MNTEEKKVYLLIKAVIFHYHGLDEEEMRLLKDTAVNMDALDELGWVMEYIGSDYYSAYERARDYLKEIVQQYDKGKKLSFLRMIWNANTKKGYISEMEAMAILQLAKDWEVASELVEMIKHQK